MREDSPAPRGNFSRSTKKEIFMDTYEILTPTATPVKAQKKHIVLFVIACVLLAGALVCGCMMVSLRVSPPGWEDPGEEYGPLGSMAWLLSEAVYALMTLIVTFLFGISWAGGQVISTLLAMEKRNKPRGLWIASLVIALVYAALILCVVGIGIWA